MGVLTIGRQNEQSRQHHPKWAGHDCQQPEHKGGSITDKKSFFPDWILDKKQQ